MKFRLTVEVEYEVPDDQLEGVYGTTDPRECARIDERNSAADLVEFIGSAAPTRHKIEVMP